MKAYPDTSFLCALYRLQENSAAAAAYFAAILGPLEVTSLLLFEFRQSVRFQVRLHRQDATKGFSKAAATTMLADLTADIATGALVILPVQWHQVHVIAERLSERYTEANGHRAMDILHVATALEIGASAFLTFDRNQRTLAESQGLETPL